MKNYRPIYKKVIFDDIKFDSEDEAKYYKYLKELECENKISNLEIHKTFTLIEPFIKKNGVSSNGLTYEADFVFFDTIANKWRVVDIKGFEEEHFKIKKKIFENMYCKNKDDKFDELEVLTYRKSLNGFVSTTEVKKLMKSKRKQLVEEKNYYKNIVKKQEHIKELEVRKKEREIKRMKELIELSKEKKLTKQQSERLIQLKNKYYDQ